MKMNSPLFQMDSGSIHLGVSTVTLMITLDRLFQNSIENA